jgi:hypothetical protein
MPNLKSGNDLNRKEFESVFGKRIRHKFWLQIKEEIKAAGLTLDKESVRFYATFKRHCPRKPLTKSAIAKISKFTEQHFGSDKLPGDKLFELIRKETGLGSIAIYKCFHRANLSFSKDEYYPFNDSCRVFTFAVSTRRKGAS